MSQDSDLRQTAAQLVTQLDRVEEMLGEFIASSRAGVAMRAETLAAYAAELTRLGEQRAQIRTMLAALRAQIEQRDAS